MLTCTGTARLVIRLHCLSRNASSTLFQCNTLYSTDTNNDVKSPDFQETVFKGMASHFPCLDKLKNETQQIYGLKGMYGERVGGYNIFKYKKPFKFKHGGVLSELEIAYETWGELNEECSNAILVHTGLSASAHAKSTLVSVINSGIYQFQYYVYLCMPILELGDITL